MPDPLLLVADVGGTNTRVGLARGTVVDTASVKRYRNADHAGLEDVLARYLAEVEATPDAAAADAAGPLIDGKVRLTNLDWTVSPDGLRAATGCATVSVLNDLQAQGHALPFIDEANLPPVITGSHVPADSDTRLVINVGTGLNAALVLQHRGDTIVPPSETGHIGLLTPTPDLRDLGNWLRDRHGFASAEEALSGRGVGHVYAWACDVAGVPNYPPKSSQEVMSLLADGDAQAVMAGRAFATALGALASSLALIHLPFGGIYLSGGISRAFARHLSDLGFESTFHAKGRFSDYMRQFSVRVLEDDYAPLTGCTAHLMKLL
ncbi:glucokinase [Pseudaestuariivita atlantica]|uniref:Glucokinase n=1 Tax=Pseudaestuariivita atlantica TaxID=1317121 RepID=A0A0L1JV69_9RHOB|nr:glucokinase [Pseudaestuariivita atlantica]KNG95587.1 hypothetical protein ATO11_03110 [Pseudaestuariivita atlantica]